MRDQYLAAVERGELAPDPAQLELLPEFEAIRAYLDNGNNNRRLPRIFGRNGEAPKGIYLWGGVGRGKSMLMDLLVNSVRAPKRRVHFHALMQEVHSAMHEARKQGLDDALRPVADRIAASVRLLALDEMQITDITDAMIVGRLFEALLAAGVVIVTTSNRPPDDLYKDGLNRQLFLPFIELLKTRMHVHHLHSPTDYRQGMMAGQQVYFCPADAKARAAMDRLWDDLAGGEGQPLRLEVKGRTVEIPLFRNGVARATFWDMCGRPLGPADYLAVAGAVRVLLLEEVPRLSRSNYNEARRFVTLIDTLYEARVRLIVSAADIPERLYVEGEGTFEFGRTASRLREMQSENWAS